MQGGDDDHDSDDLVDEDLQAPRQCSKRLFHSQGTPEAAPFTEDQQGNKPFSQETLLKAVMPEIEKGTIPPTAAEKRRNKARKRKVKNDFASSSQPVPKTKEPLRAKDNVGVSEWHSFHQLAKPILPPRLSKLLRGDMRSLHEGIHRVEKLLLCSSNPLYPLYPVKVPKNLGYADEYPADVFFVRFEEIFDMYHMKRLPICFVRLLCLNMQYQLMKEETKLIAIMDSYHLQEGRLNHSDGAREVAIYIQKFFIQHQDKRAILMPYFPE
jgi:hypothetical protein